jgi:hypothetical protein
VAESYRHEEDVKMRNAILSLGFVFAVALAGQARAGDIDWTKVDAALGKTASVQGDVHRYGIPRSDLQVTLDGVAIKRRWRSAAGSASSRRRTVPSSWAISC